MQKSNVHGGRAGLNSVIYMNDNYKVIATRKRQDNIEIEIIPLNSSKLLQISQHIRKIPFIRGIWMLIEGISVLWKLIIVSIFLLIINQFLINTSEFKGGTGGYTKLYYVINDYRSHFFIIIGFLLIFAVVTRITQLGKYHGAEHMVDNAYVASKNLSLSNVRKYSRIHPSCGTNLVVFILLLYLIVLKFTNDVKISILLSYILGYEIFMIKNPFISLILKPFYFIGYLLQKYFFTSVPEHKHIQVAIAAYETIIKKSQ